MPNGWCAHAVQQRMPPISYNVNRVGIKTARLVSRGRLFEADTSPDSLDRFHEVLDPAAATRNSYR